MLSKELLDKEDSILKRISSTQRELWHEDISKDREQELRKELAAGESALEQFQLEVRRSNPQYAALKHLETFSAQRIQRELLDSETGLIEYFVGEEKSFAWLVSKNKISYAVMPSQKELKRLIGDYRKSIAEKSNGPAAKQSMASFNIQSRQLYHLLIQPFAGSLSSLRRLIIVPDSALSYLPFETLMTDRRVGSGSAYLLERLSISYEPSASALAAIPRTTIRTPGRRDRRPLLRPRTLATMLSGGWIFGAFRTHAPKSMPSARSFPPPIARFSSGSKRTK